MSCWMVESGPSLRVGAWNVCWIRTTARSGPLSITPTERGCFRSQTSSSKRISQASWVRGTSLKACSKLPHPPRRYGFLAISFVDQAGDAAGMHIDFDAEKLVLDIRAINL